MIGVQRTVNENKPEQVHINLLFKFTTCKCCQYHSEVIYYGVYFLTFPQIEAFKFTITVHINYICYCKLHDI